jgi:hypothetical protein
VPLAALIPVCLVLLLADQPRAPDSHIIAVSVAPEQACPAARPVTEALAARLPGAVLPYGQGARPGMLRLSITSDATSIRIDLADPDGAPLLHRVIAPARAPGECAPLADTIALIIERYWREVGYDAPPLQPPAPPTPPPPPPPPPPAPAPVVTPAATVEKQAPPPTHERAQAPVPLRLSVAAAIAGRAGNEGARDGSASIVVAAQSRVGVRVSAGVSTGATAPVDAQRDASFRRYPLRLGAYLPLSIGLGHLEPGVGFDMDLISAAIPGDAGLLRSPSSCSGGLCWAPGGDLALGWSIASPHHVYVRALARAGLSASYNFAPMNGDVKGDPFWRTPSTYLELGVESGLWFP